MKKWVIFVALLFAAALATHFWGSWLIKFAVANDKTVDSIKKFVELLALLAGFGISVVKWVFGDKEKEQATAPPTPAPGAGRDVNAAGRDVQTGGARVGGNASVADVVGGDKIGGDKNVAQSGDNVRGDKVVNIYNTPPEPHRSSLHTVLSSEESVSEPRVLDAALPGHVVKGRGTELLALIRLPDSEGLKGVLIEDREAEARPEDVRSKPFCMNFPVGADQKPQSVIATVSINSPDFSPSQQSRNLIVPPGRNSDTYSFVLTPTKTGKLTVLVELQWEDVLQGSRRLLTECVAEAAGLPAKVGNSVVSLPFAVRAAAATKLLSAPMAPAPTSSGGCGGGVESEWGSYLQPDESVESWERRLVRCEYGHFYDPTKHKSCPYDAPEPADLPVLSVGAEPPGRPVPEAEQEEKARGITIASAEGGGGCGGVESEPDDPAELIDMHDWAPSPPAKPRDKGDFYEALEQETSPYDAAAQERAAQQSFVHGDAVRGDKNVVADGDVVKGDKIVYQSAAASPPPLTSLFQLPPPPADFTGREADLRELRQAIEHGGVHISGLQGQGGVGKTALALKLAAELAPRFPDVQIFLDLKGATEKPLTAVEALAYVLRSFHPEAKLPEKEEDLKALFTSVLHGKRVLLLMDNARDAKQVEPLIPPMGSALLVTSRASFTLPGLKQKKLDTLPPEDARKLLVKIEPRISNAADAMAKACGYLALALRLAATAIAERADLDPEDYGRRLADESRRLKLLAEAGRDPSMEASIGLSYNLLNSEMQTRWRMLGVFPDSFDIQAAAAVWAIGDDAAQGTLSDLVRFSMLEWGDNTKRYRLHDLMRDFARGKLTEVELDAAALRHARHYAGVLRAADQLYLQGGDSFMRGLVLFDLERGNIEAGQAWAAAHSQKNREAAELCSGYPHRGAYVLHLRQHPLDNIRWLESAVSAARRLDDRRAEANRLGNLGVAYDLLGERSRAIEHHEQALAIHREIGDRRGEGKDWGNLGNAYQSLGEHSRAAEYHRRNLAIALELGDRREESNALDGLGNAYLGLGEYRRAIEYYEQDLAIAREIGDRKGEGTSHWNMSLALDALGERRQAIAHAEAALKIREEIEDPNAAKVRRKLEIWRRES
jgi:tetratricopeptide (TPR) repeat protein